jgi:hypothetical protein
LNTQYFIQEFYQYAGYPKFNKYNNTYSAGCPICMEGASWGHKRRLYYLVETNRLFCHNCGWSGTMIKWLMQTTGKTYEEITSESSVVDISNRIEHVQEAPKLIVDDLPTDSINLYDKEQLQYWSKDSVFMDCVELVVNRRLHRAVNRPKALYLSLNDKVHKNRICLPFYDNNKIIHYQTRSVYSADKPKYLSKINSTKSLFNYDNIQIDGKDKTVYITEGPIDACFIKNGVAVAGIQPKSNQLFSTLQQEQISRLFMWDQVWVLDSQITDKTSRDKTSQLLQQGHKVFIWPRDLGNNYKDLNDYCVDNNVDEFPSSLIKENTFSGPTGVIRLKITDR